MRTRLLLLGGAALIVAGGWWLAARPPSVEVRPDESVEAVLQTVPEGAVIRLLPGLHDPFEVDRALTIEGVPGTTVGGPITVLADGVALRDLVVRGGETGILVREADDVTMERVVVGGARLHGIEIAPGSATVRDCRIEGLRSPFAQGLEVRNSSGRPHTVVEGCSVSSGQEGLVSHVSRVEFRQNVVTDTTLRALVITEMSEGLAEDNAVTGVAGIGLYCGDESHCEFRGNTVRDVAAAPAGRSHGGYGAVALYKATMRLRDNSFAVLAAPRPVGLFLDSRVTEAFPLSVWPPGWAGAVPALWVAGLSLLGVALVRWAVIPLVRARAPVRPPALAAGAAGVLIAGLAVQSFHMVEHVVQVIQVYVLDAEHRSGLLGAVVDTEWVHFAYNLAVLAFLAWLWALVRPGGRTPLPWRPASWALAALLVQGYHFVEHAAKLVQHIAWGVDPAPGLLGGRVGLVWFHFGINLAVYVAMAIPVVAALRARPAPAPVPSRPERVTAAA